MPLGKIGDVYVDVRAKSDKLRSDLSNAQGQIRGAMSRISTAAGNFARRAGTVISGAALAGWQGAGAAIISLVGATGKKGLLIAGALGVLALAIGKFFTATIGRMDEAKQLSEWATLISAPFDELAKLDAVAKTIRVDTEEIVDAIRTMQERLYEADEDSEEALRWIMTLGLNLEDLKKMSPTDQMWALGEAIMALDDPLERAAALSFYFGDEGAKAFVKLWEGSGRSKEGFEKLAEQAVASNSVISESTAIAAQQVDAEWTKLKQSLKAPFTGFTDWIIPHLAKFLKWTNEVFLHFLAIGWTNFINIVKNAWNGGLTDMWNKVVGWYDNVMGKINAVKNAAEAVLNFVGALGIPFQAVGQGLGIPSFNPLTNLGELNENMWQGLRTAGQPQTTTVNNHYGDNWGVDDTDDRINEAVRAGDRSGLPRARGNN